MTQTRSTRPLTTDLQIQQALKLVDPLIGCYSRIDLKKLLKHYNIEFDQFRETPEQLEQKINNSHINREICIEQQLLNEDNSISNFINYRRIQEQQNWIEDQAMKKGSKNSYRRQNEQKFSNELSYEDRVQRAAIDMIFNRNKD